MSVPLQMRAVAGRRRMWSGRPRERGLAKYEKCRPLLANLQSDSEMKFRGDSIEVMLPVQPGDGGSSPTSPLHHKMSVMPIPSQVAISMVIEKHYLHRRTSVSFAFGLFHDGEMVGVCTFGCPPSRHLQMGACPTDPSKVIELNRLWVSDSMARNTESWFIARSLRLLPPMIVVSYADTSWGHIGYIYRASNWNYAGWTDMERKTPRYDYIAPGKHTRDAFRGGLGANSTKIRRKPKHKYWITTGNRRQRKQLAAICGWPLLQWEKPLPTLAPPPY